MFVGNYGGYALLAFLIFVLVLRGRQGGLSLRHVLYAVVLLGSALAVIYPVAHSLRLQWSDHGTWYRAVFFLNSALLFAAGYLIVKMDALVRRIAATAALAFALLGGFVTQKKWEAAMTRYEREGKYYLKHESRLIYSELPAFWFLDGVRALYALPLRHHVTDQDSAAVRSQQLSAHDTIWRFVDGKYVKDSALHAQLTLAAQITE